MPRRWYLPLSVPLPNWGWLRRLMNRPMLNCDNCMGPIWSEADIRTDQFDNALCPQCGDPETLRDLAEADPGENQAPYPEDLV